MARQDRIRDVVARNAFGSAAPRLGPGDGIEGHLAHDDTLRDL
jgi:hypothetical protein